MIEAIAGDQVAIQLPSEFDMLFPEPGTRGPATSIVRFPKIRSGEPIGATAVLREGVRPCQPATRS